MADNPKVRAPLSRGEAITLLGMVAAVLSPALAWQAAPPAAPAPGALYVSRRPVAIRGFDLRFGSVRVGAAVAGLGILCGLFLLWSPAAEHTAIHRSLRCATAAAILIVAVLHVGPYPG